MVKLLGIAGALRAASTNRMLVAEAFRLFGPAETRWGDLRMPLYDEDAEEAHGLPPEAQALVEACRWADAVVISTPEYNKSLPGVLKNALDWISRARPGVLRDKPVAILSASDGQYAGERAQVALRQVLVPFRPLIVNGPEVLVSWSRSEAFDAEGRLVQERALKALGETMALLRAALG